MLTLSIHLNMNCHTFSFEHRLELLRISLAIVLNETCTTSTGTYDRCWLRVLEISLSMTLCFTKYVLIIFTCDNHWIEVHLKWWYLSTDLKYSRSRSVRGTSLSMTRRWFHRFLTSIFCLFTYTYNYTTCLINTYVYI